jgi:hypothetical protein
MEDDRDYRQLVLSKHCESEGEQITHSYRLSTSTSTKAICIWDPMRSDR